jgi:hypothetical protein
VVRDIGHRRNVAIVVGRHTAEGAMW